MEDSSDPKGASLDTLKERAKELDCLYQVDEILGNSRLTLTEMFERIVLVLPSGFRFPEVCRVEIAYDNHRYQSADFARSRISDGVDIKAGGKVVGRITVTYIDEVSKTDEGYFLEKEKRLIKTIADRIEQTIFQKSGAFNRRVTFQKRMVFQTSYRCRLDGNNSTLTENRPGYASSFAGRWLIISAIAGSESRAELCKQFRFKGVSVAGEVNFPSQMLPLGDLAKISEKAFSIASKHMTDGEISTRLMKWIQETKAYTLIKTIDRIDTSIGDVVEAVSRYTNTAGTVNMLDPPTERWLRVALIRRFLSDKPGFIRIAQQYLDIRGFYDIVQTLIYPAGSHGKIGGKATGLFLAKEVLKRESERISLLMKSRYRKHGT